MDFGPRSRESGGVHAHRKAPLWASLGCAFFLSAPGGAGAQERPAQPARDTVPAAAAPDTVPAPTRADTAAPRAAAAVRPDTSEGVSPGGAFLRSLVIPGWGQSAVGSPGRGAVYFALEAGSLWMVYKSRKKLSFARRNQDFLHQAGLLDPDLNTSLVNSRESQVEDWITLAGFLLFFNAADAYVAAYLRDFEEHIGVAPNPRGGANLQLTVPLGRRP